MADNNTEALTQHLMETIDIKGILQSKGPVVKCVLLHHMSPTGKDLKPHAVSENADEQHRRQVIPELVEEIEIDTTPSKNEVKKILKGPFTFIGQYPDEGIVVMARKVVPSQEELTKLSIAILRSYCQDYGIDTQNLLEKSEFVTALANTTLPINPNKLQPPFDKREIHGDILLMRIAETDEFLDDDDEDDAEDDDDEVVEGDDEHDDQEDGIENENNDGSNNQGKIEQTNVDQGSGDQGDGLVVEKSTEQVKTENESSDPTIEHIEPKVLSNEEFFLDYTKDEWITFASRTDVVYTKPVIEDNNDIGGDVGDGDENEEELKSNENEEEDDNDNDDDDDDEDYEEEDVGFGKVLLPLQLSSAIRQFREEHGRGPDSEEVLQLRSQIADKLGVDVSSVDATVFEGKNKGSPLENEESANAHNKKVKFDPSVVKEGVEK